MDAAGGYLMALALFVFGAALFWDAWRQFGRWSAGNVYCLLFVGVLSMVAAVIIAVAGWQS